MFKKIVDTFLYYRYILSLGHCTVVPVFFIAGADLYGKYVVCSAVLLSLSVIGSRLRLRLRLLVLQWNLEFSFLTFQYPYVSKQALQNAHPRRVK